MAERTVRLSVIDRLIDTEPRLAGDRPTTWAESVRQLKASLLRDLEWLLNTRRIAEPAPDTYPEVQGSLYHFGLPDVSSISRDSQAARRQLMQQIAACVQLFEPRLDNVRVVPFESGVGNSRELHFVIEAMLRMEPNPERVIFDARLETARGEFHLSANVDD